MTIIKNNVAIIDHNGNEGERVTLNIAQDESGYYYVETGTGEDTEMRFETAEAAEDSIWDRWGNGWNLEYTE